MSLSDPISDMLVRVRNGQTAEHDVVEIPHSMLKSEIARVLKRDGYIKDYVVEGGVKKVLRVYLKYGEGGEPGIRGLRRESMPGLRKYASRDLLRKARRKLGVSILTTSAGIMTDVEARKRGVGGEVLCSVW